ncbi:alpha/beta fold hydrolase [Kribbella monticola]|uniref:alpha/beta fold hydrolase n=1 Tax=Kribbella monticola TaxID=2185285 RepID=UPI0013001BB1|nr:alpha/beta hydrolase [Kribbella monticola]
MATTKFDVGGYKLAAEISGEGSPTVVFISGSGDAGEPWEATISALHSSTTLMTYARAGIGDSEIPQTGGSRPLGAAADELRRLLVAVDIPGPFILVGHSIGGLIGLIYAAQWPENLAGLVLVDATDIHLDLELDNPYVVIDDGDREDHLSYDVVATVDEVARSRRALGVPTVVIASRPGGWLEIEDPDPWQPFTLAELDDRWQRHQRTLATDLAATHKIARAGGHYVHKDDPTVVAEAIDTLITATRNH